MIWGFIVVIGFSIAQQYHADRVVVQKWIQNWESEIALAQLGTGNPSLVAKTFELLKEQVSSLQDYGGVNKKIDNASCPLQQKITVGYSNFKTAPLVFCYDLNKIVISALTSSLFVFLFFSLLVFHFLILIKEKKQKMKQDQMNMRSENAERLADLARLVAHDIRSPLTALATISSLSHHLDSPFQDLLRNAVDRVRKISDDLLDQSRNYKYNLSGELSNASWLEFGAKNETKTELTNLKEILKTSKAEMDLVFSDMQISFNINLKYEQYSLGLDANSILRIISNLFQNSYESYSESMKEKILNFSVHEYDGSICFSIIDEGVGIPQELLRTLGLSPISYGKVNGNGLGLYGMIKKIKSANGKYQIYSREGVGTQINFSLPYSAEAISRASSVV